MHEETTAFTLTCQDGGEVRPALIGVKIEGRLDGVLFDLKLRQTYRNTSGKVLELVYTFPLPHQAVLLGFASELNGSRMQGTVRAERQAEHDYEQALAGGDAPVMLEQLENGLHTANIGNLKPGDELVMELHFAQLLSFEQGRLRLCIPTTVAPRYGSAETAGIQAQQIPLTSLTAEYPLALTLTVAGLLAQADLDCPTHRFSRELLEASTKLTLDHGAWLDRDLVLSVRPAEVPTSLLVQAVDSFNPDAPTVVMASFQPRVGVPRPTLALKILLDCSGSMAGDSMACAKAILIGALDTLNDEDSLSVTRFGSRVHQILRPSAGTPRRRSELKRLIASIDADLGGTEMEVALRAVFALPTAGTQQPADVLLVTDGEIWEVDPVIAAARVGGHRVFVIGVGTSPAESVLRKLAEATGGAAEFATPGEVLETAARRMLTRMRQASITQPVVEWGTEVAWQTAMPATIFGGDTVVVMAGMAAGARASPRLKARDSQGADIEVAPADAPAASLGDALARIAAARRLAASEGAAALSLALTYQLMSSQTNFILVHQRAADEKADTAAELQRVEAMLPAGWGGTASVLPFQRATVADDMKFCFASVNDAGGDFAGIEVPAFLCGQADDAPQLASHASLQEIAETVFEHLEKSGQIQDLASHCQSLVLEADVAHAIDELARLLPQRGYAWLLLASWVGRHTRVRGSDAVAAVLQQHLHQLDARLTAEANRVLEDWLGSSVQDALPVPRMQRLLRAMSRTA